MAPWTRIALLAALALAVWAPPAGAAGLARPDDPVVLSGATVPQLRGVAPADVVAFAWSDGWRQLPVQVDERARLDFGRPLHEAALGVGTTFYTDPATFTGGDPDPVLDADDEIALMARDAGSPAPAGGPAGVDPGSRVQLEVTDPRRPGSAGYAYLFRRTSPLDPAAGRRYVSYSFRLLSGPYLSTYDVNSGPNPELSTAGSAYYRHQFSDRWVNHALQVFVGGATGADILDRHKTRLVPGVCGRTESTFSQGPGAFIANRVGPVRAIRSYIGANSGKLTQRDHVFYERRHDIRTYLRVHQIPGIVDYFDLSPAGAGMRYRNPLNSGGVPIDGVPDSVTPGLPAWESVSGPQGAISMAHLVSTNISGLPFTSYYLDDSTPFEAQCTGDAQSLGASGPRIAGQIPTTDPRDAGAKQLSAVRHIYYEPPGAGAATAAERAGDAFAPLRVSARGGPFALELRSRPSLVTYGRRSRLSGRVSGPVVPVQTVIVERSSPPGRRYRRVATATSGPDGAFSLRVRPRGNARYRVRVAGARSPRALVRVRPRISLRVRRRVLSRSLVRFRGRVCPAHRGRRASVQRRRGKRWVRVARARLRGRRGARCSRYSRRVRVRRDATYRVVLRRHHDHATGVSRRRRVDAR